MTAVLSNIDQTEIPGDFALSTQPALGDIMKKFKAWFDAAQNVGLREPASVVVSSITEDGFPASRVLLCRGISDAGVTFYTNFNSAKGREFAANPKAAATFHWMPLRRQVRFQGTVHAVADEVADAYWAQRGRESQLFAAASDQSSPLESQDAFEAEVDVLRKKFDGVDVPRPQHWSGYTLTPRSVEFWTEGKNRNHHRVFCREQAGEWALTTLSP